MDAAATFLDAVVAALERASAYNHHDQAPPAAVLWPDKDGQWAPLLPALRARLPLLTLGPYAPEERTGPAYWLRCMIARTLDDDRLPPGAIPIIYLPGVSRQELRAVEDCPKPLQPLAELQYRGVLWTHRNGRDWTVAAFLHGALGIEVGADAATREALGRALRALAGEPVARLRKEAPLRAPFFDALLNPDEVKSLLLWLGDPAGARARRDPGAWAAFVDLCRRKYGFHPEQDGEVTAAGLLGGRKGPWELVWRRFAEAPGAYPRLPALLRRAHPQGALFGFGETWPQDNEAAEAHLRERLLALSAALPGEARAAIAALEEEHGVRRGWVWAALGQAPLAAALAHLAALARETERAPGGPSVAEIAAAYAEGGWRADAAVVAALAAVEDAADVGAVKAAAGALYRPWLEAGATALQRAVAAAGPGQGYAAASPPTPEAGTCLLFCDGLRFDAGRHLAAALEARGLACEVAWRLAALPTVTPTAKPAVSPVAGEFAGGAGLEPALRASGARVTVEVFRKALADAGYQVLRGDDLGDPTGRAWAEHGAIDSYGHGHEWKLAHHLAGEVRSVAGRVAALLANGWRRVVVVTDHGWLLLPGGLPKVELPQHLTDVRKGRCARLKPGASTDQQIVPWFWDADVRIALAPGIACFEAGKEYEHGGLSPQECVVPALTVMSPADARPQVTIESVRWTGLRCRVQLAGTAPGLAVDLRGKPADPASSLTNGPKTPNASGQVSLAVADDSLEGTLAMVVLLDGAGRTLAQRATTVGGDAA